MLASPFLAEKLLRRVPPLAAYVALSLLLFGSVLFAGHVLYFRDITYYYYPNYVFLERSFRAGVFPLWDSWKLTVLATWNYTRIHTNDNFGATLTQVGLYGKNFALDNNPANPTTTLSPSASAA